MSHYPSPLTQVGNKPSRSTSRAMTQLAERTDLAIAQVAARTHLELAVLDGVDLIAARGMQGVATVSQLEQSLAQAVPIASGRLQLIGDVHAQATAQIVANAVRNLR